MAIFKAYDIRGVVPDELDAEDAFRIGSACARFFGAPAIVVGRDARASSPELRQALVRGITTQGVGVFDVGLVATPMLYFAVEHLGAGGGIMLTASHNPARYNGFKICREHAIPVGEASGLREIERLCFEPDGSFPNHPADPLVVENLADVREAVRRVGADFGVAFDGDADRAVFIDERGEPVSSDLMTGILARSQLRRAPGGTVLYDLRSSWATPEEIEAAGGRPQMCRVGHSFVKAQMRESGAIFAGELSGHFYFRFTPCLVADDGIAAFVALLDVLGREKRPLSELIAPLRRYFASGELNRAVPDPRALMAEVEAEHRDATEISHLDGLLVRYPDWWFNLRPSNTEPLLRLNLEARTAQQMEAERDRLIGRMEAAGRGGEASGEPATRP
jgi:phosphomannomutase